MHDTERHKHRLAIVIAVLLLVIAFIGTVILIGNMEGSGLFAIYICAYALIAVLVLVILFLVTRILVGNTSDKQRTFSRKRSLITLIIIFLSITGLIAESKYHDYAQKYCNGTPVDTYQDPTCINAIRSGNHHLKI
jgi:heme A synthase